MIEEWRDVVSFEGLYQISSLGRIRSLSRPILHSRGGTRKHCGKMLSPALDKDGYPRIVLRVNGVYHTRKIHRLVCEAFNGPPNALHRQVDHIDGDRANAAATNLRWVSHAENHYYRRGKPCATKTMLSKLTDEQARQVRSATISRGVPSSLARQFGVPRHVIYDILRGRTWRHS